ncbi:MAG: hypothetical protein H0V17_03150, partial [Deltaproteobacteria bacterium]|nr:hypothetical protein [Deltaproteobacteria bacterium]
MVTTLGLLLAACGVGEVNGLGGDTDAPIAADPRAATFDTEVRSRAMAKGCLDVGCHGGVQTPQ